MPCYVKPQVFALQALRQHAADSDVSVTAAALGTLSRVACACARLHLRDEILASPDVVLSIMLLEDGMEAQVGMLHWSAPCLSWKRSTLCRTDCNTLTVTPACISYMLSDMHRNSRREVVLWCQGIQATLALH